MASFRFLTFIHDCHTDRVTSASEKNVEVSGMGMPRSLNQQNLITSGLYPDLKRLLSIDKLNRSSRFTQSRVVLSGA